MKLLGTPFPLPVRVAAGLALSAVENAKDLPRKLAELPVSMVSQALQTSMRMQQHITELAIKGDDALSAFRPVEETPEWATFDEDSPAGGGVGLRGRSAWDDAADLPVDPWTTEEQALTEEAAAGSVVVDADELRSDPPAAYPDYDELSLPQLRARLRTFSLPELEELLAYERAHANRADFTGMLGRRIDTVRETEA